LYHSTVIEVLKCISKSKVIKIKYTLAMNNVGIDHVYGFVQIPVFSRRARDTAPGQVNKHGYAVREKFTDARTIKISTERREGFMIEAFKDPNHEGNSSRYHTGKPCIEIGCNDPAGTAWSPYWCFKHNLERIDRITQAFTNCFTEAFAD